MKVVLQRVSRASVEISGNEISSINQGYVVLLGIEKNDNIEDLEYLVTKIIGLRLFNDINGNMNLSIQETNKDILVVSQFTLCADTSKGRRPSFIGAAEPDLAKNLYKLFCSCLVNYDVNVKTGQFGATMLVSLINDGPVTIILDSKNR